MAYKNKQDQAEYFKKYREKNREKINENARKPERIEKRRQYLLGYSSEKKEQIAKTKSDYYKENKQFVKDRVKARANEHLDLVLAIKKCYGCMNKDCRWMGELDPRVLEFHHVDPEEKSYNVLERLTSSKKTLAQEINKCVCLCPNCHKLAHLGLVNIVKKCCVNCDLGVST
jgi:hypothetical protein